MCPSDEAARTAVDEDGTFHSSIQPDLPYHLHQLRLPLHQKHIHTSAHTSINHVTSVCGRLRHRQVVKTVTNILYSINTYPQRHTHIPYLLDH